MDELFDFFEQMAKKAKSVELDIAILQNKMKDKADAEKKDEKAAKEKEVKEKNNSKSEPKSKEEIRIVSSTSTEPMTRLRKDESEARDAIENPEMTFVEDRINDIFK